MNSHSFSWTLPACLVLAAALSAQEAAVNVTGALNQARMGHLIARLPGGKIAVFGGHGPGFVSLSSAEIFDPGTGQYSGLSMNFSHDAGLIARLADGRILLAGGSADWGIPAFGDGELFDPATGTFTPTGGLVRFRAFAGAGTLSSGKVLVAGGWWTHNDAYSYGELYDPATGVFSATGPLTTARAGCFVLPCSDGTGVVVGGIFYTGGALEPSPEVYSPSENTFSPLASWFDANPGWNLVADYQPTDSRRMPNGKYGFIAYKAAQYEFIVFDPAAKGFAPLAITPALPLGSDEALYGPYCPAEGNHVYLVGMQASGTVVMRRIDCTTGAMVTTQNDARRPSSYSLYGAGTVLLPNGAVLFSGGTSGDNFSALADSFAVSARFTQPPSLSLALYAGLTITGRVGANHRIEYATELAPEEWRTLAEIALPESPYLFVDRESANAPRRFYRAIELP